MAKQNEQARENAGVPEVPSPRSASERKSDEQALKERQLKRGMGRAGEAGSISARQGLEHIFAVELSQLTEPTRADGSAWPDGHGEIAGPHFPKSMDIYFGTVSAVRGAAQVIGPDDEQWKGARGRIMMQWDTASWEDVAFNGIPALVRGGCIPVIKDAQRNYQREVMARGGYGSVMGKEGKAKTLSAASYDHGQRSSAARKNAKRIAVELQRKFGDFPKDAPVTRNHEGKGSRRKAGRSGIFEVRCGVVGCDGGGQYQKVQWAVLVATKGGPPGCLSFCGHPAKPTTKHPGYVVQKVIGVAQPKEPFPLVDWMPEIESLQRLETKEAERVKAELQKIAAAQG